MPNDLADEVGTRVDYGKPIIEAAKQLKLLKRLADDMPIELTAGQLRALLATARAEGAAEERELRKEVIDWIKDMSPSNAPEVDEVLKHYGYSRAKCIDAGMRYAYEHVLSLLEDLTTKEIDHAEE